MSWLMWLALFLLVIAAVVSKFRNAKIVMVRQNKKADSGAAERMVCCTHCSVYIPESEAISRSGAFFCSSEHSTRHFSN